MGTAPLRRVYGDRVCGDSPFEALENWKGVRGPGLRGQPHFCGGATGTAPSGTEGDRLHGDSPSAEVVRGQGVRGQPPFLRGDSPFFWTT